MERGAMNKRKLQSALRQGRGVSIYERYVLGEIFPLKEGPAFADPFFWGQGVQIIVPEEKSVGSSVGFSCIIRPGVVLNRRATSARFSPA